jgi:hypothetical protein
VAVADGGDADGRAVSLAALGAAAGEDPPLSGEHAARTPQAAVITAAHHKRGKSVSVTVATLRKL